MRKVFVVSLVAGAMAFGASAPASASTGKGNLFHDGAVVGTVVVPVGIPGQGIDPFYAVTNGAANAERPLRSYPSMTPPFSGEPWRALPALAKARG